MTIDAARLAALLTTERYGRSLDVHTRTTSTNDDARVAAEHGAPDGHVVVADAQDAGRGAHGNVWDSATGTDLYLSIVSRARVPLADLPLITLATGLGVHACVAEVAGQAAQVKWPNDVLIGDRKCAGILVETSSLGGQIDAVVIGIGLNVNRSTFAPELSASATSLALLSGRDHDREAVLASLLGHVETWVDRLVATGAAPVVAALEERLAWRGERVVCGETTGELRGIDAHGALLVAGEHGRIARVLSGTLRRAGAT